MEAGRQSFGDMSAKTRFYIPILEIGLKNAHFRLFAFSAGVNSPFLDGDMYAKSHFFVHIAGDRYAKRPFFIPIPFAAAATVAATANLYRGRNHRRAPQIYTAAATVPRRAPHIFG
ncbi:MAG: hypothetical protein OXU98_07650 [Gammaproteobacteria bacterium]|nr:hypothetical protein [Gammaproteobacteria bacterium]